MKINDIVYVDHPNNKKTGKIKCYKIIKVCKEYVLGVNKNKKLAKKIDKRDILEVIPCNDKVNTLMTVKYLDFTFKFFIIDIIADGGCYTIVTKPVNSMSISHPNIFNVNAFNEQVRYGKNIKIEIKEEYLSYMMNNNSFCVTNEGVMVSGINIFEFSKRMLAYFKFTQYC